MKYYNTSLGFSTATLLSVNEVMTLLTPKDRRYPYSWWLRTSGSCSNSTCFVSHLSQIYSDGTCDAYVSAIRPALIISSLGDYKVGDVFSIGGYYFKIISPTRAWLYKQDIGCYTFGKSNDYNTSLAKEIVDSWFKKLKEEMV